MFSCFLLFFERKKEKDNVNLSILFYLFCAKCAKKSELQQKNSHFLLTQLKKKNREMMLEFYAVLCVDVSY